MNFKKFEKPICVGVESELLAKFIKESLDNSTEYKYHVVNDGIFGDQKERIVVYPDTTMYFSVNDAFKASITERCRSAYELFDNLGECIDASKFEFEDNVGVVSVSCNCKQEVEFLVAALKSKGCSWTSGMDINLHDFHNVLEVLHDHVVHIDTSRLWKDCLFTKLDTTVAVPTFKFSEVMKVKCVSKITSAEEAVTLMKEIVEELIGDADRLAPESDFFNLFESKTTEEILEVLQGYKELKEED